MPFLFPDFYTETEASPARCTVCGRLTREYTTVPTPYTQYSEYVTGVPEIDDTIICAYCNCAGNHATTGGDA